jgi:hypothetical protein
LISLTGWKVHNREERKMKWGRKRKKQIGEGKRREGERKRVY